MARVSRAIDRWHVYPITPTLHYACHLHHIQIDLIGAREKVIGDRWSVVVGRWHVYHVQSIDGMCIASPLHYTTHASCTIFPYTMRRLFYVSYICCVCLISLCVSDIYRVCLASQIRPSAALPGGTIKCSRGGQLGRFKQKQERGRRRGRKRRREAGSGSRREIRREVIVTANNGLQVRAAVERSEEK
jgi:hypothetical protein